MEVVFIILIGGLIGVGCGYLLVIVVGGYILIMLIIMLFIFVILILVLVFIGIFFGIILVIGVLRMDLIKVIYN